MTLEETLRAAYGFTGHVLRDGTAEGALGIF
jgi:hypothetical protein